jgi:hypothetical protein
MHPVAIVEQRGRPAQAVHEETMEPPVQACGKSRVLLSEVNQVRWASRIEPMPAAREVARRSWRGKLLSGEGEN